MNFSNLKLSASPQSLAYGARLRPVRDWFAVLGLLALLLLAGIAWSAYTFVAVKNGEIIGSAPAPSQTPVNSASLQSVESLFGSRAGQADKYKSGAYTFVDPAK